VFYGQLGEGDPRALRSLPEGAMHADVAVAGDDVAIAWKRFDGERTSIESLISWHGEQPRAYQYDASGARTPVSGVIAPDRFAPR
jgi:hypothetical protein